MNTRHSLLATPLLGLLPEVDRMNRLMTRIFGDVGPVSAVRFPATNVVTNEQEIVLQVAVPGIEVKDVDLSVEGQTLVLKVTRPATAVAAGQNLVREERPTGGFVRTFELPYPVDTSRVEATLRQGLLRVALPRTEADRPRRISVRAA